MSRTIRERTTVKRGGIVEIRHPSLPEGVSAEVVVTIADASPSPTSPLSTYLGKGKGAFASAEEADEYVSHERDAWEA